MTELQSRVWTFMLRYQAENGAPPTSREIADEFGWASHNAAVCHMEALLKKGYIRKHRGRSRGWVAISPGQAERAGV